MYLVKELQKTLFDEVVGSRSMSISGSKGSSTIGSGREYVKCKSLYHMLAWIMH